MNFDRCETVLSRLMIRHRDTANLVRFRLNDNQTKMHAIVKETKAKKRPLFFISLKSRRVGVSSYVDGLGFCHVLAQPNANALILSHDFQSTTELFKVPLALAKSLPFKLDPVPISKKIYVQHSAGRSEMSIATAGSPEFGRGWTLSFLHLSECSRYPAEAAFPSLIHALSLHQDNLLVLESTANGRKIGRAHV